MSVSVTALSVPIGRKERDERDGNPNGKRNGIKEWSKIHYRFDHFYPWVLESFKGTKLCPPPIIKGVFVLYRMHWIMRMGDNIKGKAVGMQSFLELTFDTFFVAFFLVIDVEPLDSGELGFET
ncbi:hypothetical protein VNO77_00789 [Canavalia gladiata]|uniref:Uncharacterized protein n=1 Tax=Canavalia gladiata TaxID=3824 RepID=A0AAN9R5N3_CANGL